MSMIGIQRPGGYAGHLRAPHPRYLVDAGGVEPVWAATPSCAGLSTCFAPSKLQPMPRDEWVAVVGAGGRGKDRADPDPETAAVRSEPDAG